MRVLVLIPTLPYTHSKHNRFTWLSKHGVNGDIIVGWGAIQGDQEIELLVKLAKVNTTGFKYHVLFISRLMPYCKALQKFIFYIQKGISLGFRNHYDVIVSYSPQLNGLAAVVLKVILRKKLIVMVQSNSIIAQSLVSKNIGLLGQVKVVLSQLIIKFVLNRADHLHLLYPSQVDGYTRTKNVTVFHDYTPIEDVIPSSSHNNYILFLGYPWFLKGIDILIKAFNLIAKDFPTIKLKIVGHCPDRSFFENLVDGNTQIELCRAVYHEEAMNLMRDCCLFVLPSRTEGMGRCLIEAMATGKPVVASNVDGIPTIVKHQYNGLLFMSEDVGDLAEKLRWILTDQELASRLSLNGLHYALTMLTPDKYAQKFVQMVAHTVMLKHKAVGL